MTQTSTLGTEGPASVDPELFAQALAEVRAIRTVRPAAPVQEPTSPQSCCSGDRAGYQRHKRRGEEACEASKAAATAYHQSWRGSEGPREPAGCGSYSGYVLHRSRGEDVLPKEAGGCGCLEAKAEYSSAYYAANRERINARRRRRAS